MKNPRIEVSPDKTALAADVADFIIARFTDSTRPFALNLSGGSTPKALYELLATGPYREKLDWQRIQVFFGDERFVPMDHKDSNFRMVREALLAHVPIPANNVHPVPTETSEPSAAATAYEATLKSFYGQDRLEPARPVFQLTLLGLGEDGHTASLFPGTDALRERSRWVTSVIGAKPEPRITMTYPILASSDAVVLLVAGADKREILGRVLKGDASLPASHIKAERDLFVFCDEAAGPNQ